MGFFGAAMPPTTTLAARSSFPALILLLRRARSARSAANRSRGALPRFHSPSLPSSKGMVVRIQGDEFWHMTRVLRLGVDDRVELFNGMGALVEGSIQRIDKTGSEIVALEDPKTITPQGIQWHVFAAFVYPQVFPSVKLPRCKGNFTQTNKTRFPVVPWKFAWKTLGAHLGTLKGGRADWLIEKCTELGASSVTPLLTERSHTIGENRVDRLQRVIFAAVKQCQRLHEMTLNPPMNISSFLPVVARSKLSFLAAAEATPLFHVLPNLGVEDNGVLIVGPEGDFTEEEVKAMREAGAIPVGLGPCRLRVETATISLLSALMLWSDAQKAETQ